MTDQEFDVLDELYFVLSFEQLKDACALTIDELVATLKALYQKGWIRVLNNIDEDAPEPIDLVGAHDSYFYLASKEGLLAHNSN